MQTSVNLGVQVIQLAQGQPLEGERGLKLEHLICLSQHFLMRKKKKMKARKMLTCEPVTLMSIAQSLNWTCEKKYY